MFCMFSLESSKRQLLRSVSWLLRSRGINGRLMRRKMTTLEIYKDVRLCNVVSVVSYRLGNGPFAEEANLCADTVGTVLSTNTKIYGESW